MLTFFIIIISDNEVELWFEQVIILPPCVHAFTAETRPHAVEDAYTHARTHTHSQHLQLFLQSTLVSSCGNKCFSFLLCSADRPLQTSVSEIFVCSSSRSSADFLFFLSSWLTDHFWPCCCVCVHVCVNLCWQSLFWVPVCMCVMTSDMATCMHTRVCVCARVLLLCLLSGRRRRRRRRLRWRSPLFTVPHSSGAFCSSIADCFQVICVETHAVSIFSSPSVTCTNTPFFVGGVVIRKKNLKKVKKFEAKNKKLVRFSSTDAAEVNIGTLSPQAWGQRSALFTVLYCPVVTTKWKVAVKPVLFSTCHLIGFWRSELMMPNCLGQRPLVDRAVNKLE